MDSLLSARIQMAISLGFHMVFAALGIGMPLLMVLAEGLWLRTGQGHYRELARKWGKATSVLFAIGAVSGTALSFELGLLWPGFMKFAGSLVGPAFALEAFAFFIEAIFLGLYLYGWDRLSPTAHWLTGIPVAVSGLMSGVLVVAVNAWMQTPVGFDVDAFGAPVNIDPLATFRSPSFPIKAIHATLACYVAVGTALAGVYAWGMLRGRNDAYHRSAVRLGMALAATTIIVQLISGDWNARMVARYQPAKLAAMEAHFDTQMGAPLLFGIVDSRTGELRLGFRVPSALSILAAHDPDAEIKGLNDFPKEDWPNVTWVHSAFQIMLASGMLAFGVNVWFWWASWRGRVWASKNLWRALVISSPLGILALEAGWLVTELGRQPWVIYGVMRTDHAVTPSSDVPSSLLVFAFLYSGLGIALVVLLRQLMKKPRKEGQAHAS